MDGKLGENGSSMVPVGKPWVIVRSCPPHPNPLPKERENYPQSLPHRRRFDLGTESAAPSPWGEGRGEGERDRRQTTWTIFIAEGTVVEGTDARKPALAIGLALAIDEEVAGVRAIRF